MISKMTSELEFFIEKTVIKKIMKIFTGTPLKKDGALSILEKKRRQEIVRGQQSLV